MVYCIQLRYRKNYFQQNAILYKCARLHILTLIKVYLNHTFTLITSSGLKKCDSWEKQRFEFLSSTSLLMYFADPVCSKQYIAMYFQVCTPKSTICYLARIAGFGNKVLSYCRVQERIVIRTNNYFLILNVRAILIWQDC